MRFVLYGGTDLDYCGLAINGYEISNRKTECPLPSSSMYGLSSSRPMRTSETSAKQNNSMGSLPVIAFNQVGIQAGRIKSPITTSVDVSLFKNADVRPECR